LPFWDRTHSGPEALANRNIFPEALDNTQPTADTSKSPQVTLSFRGTLNITSFPHDARRELGCTWRRSSRENPWHFFD
jgi:hypothetical protein